MLIDRMLKFSQEVKSFEKNSAFLFQRGSRQITRLFNKHLSQVGITSNQYFVLCELLKPHHSMTHASERLGMDRTTMMRALFFLKKESLIETRQNDGDKRKKVHFVTEKGMDALENSHKLVEFMQSVICERYESDTTALSISGDYSMLCGNIDRFIKCANLILGK